MPTYKIRGVDVDFPFEAYDCQLVYMDKVIQSLQDKCNALLESPTGTGKTLCLLCATLAWRKSLGSFSTGVSVSSSQNAGCSGSQSPTSNLPTIVYTSRTHSQIRQVIQELKRTSYRPKMVVLGSREQLCIHDRVSLLHGKAQTNACHLLRRNRNQDEEDKQHEKREKPRCAHYYRVAGYLKSNPYLGDEPIDIEDLVNIGKSSGPCPYYMSREIHKVVDILFAPYNYVIDASYRKSLALNWNNSILIFDEAHNLESICADAASFDLSSSLLSACISEAKNCIDISVNRRESSDDKSNNPDNYAILRALLLKLEKRIAEVPIGSKELGFSKPGPYMYELLADLNITHKTALQLVSIIEDATKLLEEDNQQKGKNNICRLESIGNMLNIVFSHGNAHAKFYRVHIREVEAIASDGLKGKASRTLSWWCFNPGIAMQEFASKGVGSIILTSGTLSPMDSFAQELKLDFPVRLENPHVISSNQIWVGVVPAGPSGHSFNSSYRSRDSIEYKQELGNAIVNFSRIVPDGLLVFFPSYYLLDKCIECWKTMRDANSMTIWERVLKHKKAVVEPRQSSLFLESIEDYMAKLKDTSTSGAIFFAVCRGKVSEGLDFADHAGRAVVITGMPFATLTDPKVRLKREYLDEEAQFQRKEHKLQSLTGEEWYSQQASRAVNQAVGRVIRHRHDYGAIIFCDERFSHSNRQSQISLWIQPHLKCYSKFGDVVFTLTRFFRDGRDRGPTKLKLLEIKERDTISSTKSTLVEQITDAPLDADKPSLLGSSRSNDGNTSGLKVEQSLDKFNLAKFQHKTATVGRDCSVILENVQPANRSSLTSYKHQSVISTSSNKIVCRERKLSNSSGIAFGSQNSKTIDSPGNSVFDDKSFRELLTPCPSKKRKITSTKQGVMCHDQNINAHSHNTRICESNRCSSSSSSLECENRHESDDKRMQSANVGISLLREDNKKMNAETIGQKGKTGRLSSVPSGAEETKGSEFLVQVEEKLSPSEYKEFVNSMRALKSKAMKITEVLGSIARLFSGADRFPLLKRFKDFIPAKYHSLYDQYLRTSERKSNVPGPIKQVILDMVAMFPIPPDIQRDSTHHQSGSNCHLSSGHNEQWRQSDEISDSPPLSESREQCSA